MGLDSFDARSMTREDLTSARHGEDRCGPSAAESGDDFDAGLDEALEQLAAGEALDLDSLRRRVGVKDWPRFLGILRAEQYRFHLEHDGDVALEPMLEELDDEAREHFFRTLAAARVARGVLPHKLEPGSEVRGRWIVLRRLGSGGQARVYSAYDREFAMEVALKVFDEPPPIAGETIGQVALAESRVLAHLKSRNIVRVFDVVREEGQTIVVMALVRGLVMRDAIERLAREEAQGADMRERVLRLREAIGLPCEGEHADLLAERDWYRVAARIVQVTARALQEAHAGGTVHRDLNPKNVILVGGGEPVLLDFGLAARRGKSETRGWTFPYVAPECLSDERLGLESEAQADLYQVGLILYELLTLRRAFELREGESRNAVLFRVVQGEFVPPRKLVAAVPRALEAIALHALATRPEERYASAGELVEDLERFLRGLPPRHASLRLRSGLGMRARFLMKSPVALGIAALVGALAMPTIFAHDSWRPPRVGVIQEWHGEGIPPSVAREVTDVIVRGDFALGAEVQCLDPVWLYAFRVTGEDPADEGLFVTPMGGFVVEADTPFSNGVRLEPGKHTVLCQLLQEAEPREGLLFLFTPEESPVLESLQREVAARESEFYERVRLDDIGRVLGPLADGSRGQGAQTVADLAPEVLERLRKRVKEPFDSHGLRDLWEILGVQEFLFVYPVRDAQ